MNGDTRCCCYFVTMPIYGYIILIYAPPGGKFCVVPITPQAIRKRSVSGHVSHHDRCCVGSVRVSDSVAEIPITAASV